MAQCWRCGQLLTRPGMQFCDRCGANLYWTGGYTTGGWDYTTHAERRSFDTTVSTFFYVVGVLIAVVGVIGAVLLASRPIDFPGFGAMAVAMALGALVGGGFFIFLAQRIDQKKGD